LIEPAHPRINISKQCELLQLPRSAYYYQPAGESKENLLLMRQIDEIYTRCPFWGSRSIVQALQVRAIKVNRKRVQRLMRLMGIEAIYPKPKLSARAAEHRIFPYLLRDVKITHVNQVGAQILPTFRWLRGSCIWLPSLIGIAAMSLHGSFRIPWMSIFV